MHGSACAPGHGAPLESDLVREESLQAPRTSLEEQIASIWCEVLHLERVGVHDNFFSSGGHSLLGTQVVSRIRETFAVEMPLQMLCEAPSIAAQAEYVERVRQQTTCDEDSVRIPMLDRGDEDVYQLVEMLEQLSLEEAQTLLANDAKMEHVDREIAE